MAMTLKAARVNAGLSAKDAAEILGVEPDTLRNWEKGKTFPTVPQIKKLEEAYSVPYSEINFLI